MPHTTGFVLTNDLNIHYQAFGDPTTQPIVLVHGWGSSLQGNWIDTGWVDALKPERYVVGLDVRGHGSSDKPYNQASYSYAAMCADVLAVMDELEIDKAEFIGYSMGAFMGAWLLGHRPDRFTRMVLGGIGDETAESLAVLPLIIDGLEADSIEEVEHPVSKAYRSFVSNDPRQDLHALALSAAQMWPEGYAQTVIGPGIHEVSNPVLIAVGAEDQPYVDSEPDLAASIPSGELAIVPKCDHLTAISDPAYRQAVLTFLRINPSGVQ